jgi:benzoyl-CoA reductase subunit A
MAQEYWKWPEPVHTSERINWKRAKKITAGVDIGTTSAQAVIFCDGELFGSASIYSGAAFGRTAALALERAFGGSGMATRDIEAIGATGFAAGHASYATQMFDEVSCHAKGARFMFGPEAHTVADLGGQTVKAIKLYDWDRVRDFMMGDKCATGFGRNIELMAEMLQVPITEIGERSLDIESEPEPVSTTCWSFANPETIGLFREGYREEKCSENDVIAAYIFAVAWRALGTIGKLAPLDIGDLRIEDGLAFTGGLAKNRGVTRRIERALGVEALKSEIDPMLAGAIGAALLV